MKKLFHGKTDLRSWLARVAAVCALLLAVQWIWLFLYNCQDETAAVQSYIKTACSSGFEQLYQENIKYFDDYNDENTYIQKLQALYQGVDSSQVSLAPDAYSWTADYHYYNVIVQGRTVSRLEAKRTNSLFRWKVRTDFGSDSCVINLLDPDISVQVNGIRLTAEPDMTGISAAVLPDTGITASIDIARRYEIRGLLEPPELTVSADGDVIADTDAQVYYIGRKPDSAVSSEYQKAMQDAAFAYARYTTADITYYDLTRFLYPDTDLYTAVSNFDNQWFFEHRSYDFQNVSVEHLLTLGDRAFAGTIRFDYVLQSDQTDTYPLCYRLFFVRDDSGKWMLAQLEQVTG